MFTHLDEDPGAAWRAELARVLSPGGILIATTHGAAALAKIEAEPALAESARLDPESLRTVQRRAASDGFVFVPYESDALDAANAGEVYGLSFTSAEYVARRWVGERFELVAHLPGGLRGWQDIAVLRRR